MDGKLIKNEELTRSLSRAVSHGSESLENVPALLLRIIETDAWRERYVAQLQTVVKFRHFKDYIEKQPLEGLGSTVAKIKALCEGHEAYDELRVVLSGGKAGRISDDDKSNNIVIRLDDKQKSPTGNSKMAGDNKLEKDNAELLAKVKAGELSTHAAMVKAGYRPRQKTIRIDDAESTFNTLIKHGQPDVLLELIDLLNDWREQA